jgi:hypothetical protein
MDAEWRKRIQITFVVFFVIALVRVGIIFYQRSHEQEVRKSQPKPTSSYNVTLDDYVTPHKVFPYDVASARGELAGKAAWVRVGNQLACYPYDPGTHRADLAHSAGILGPLEKIEIKDAVAQNVRGQKQVMAVFTRAGAPAEYAVSVGGMINGNYNFFINDALFLDDPHQLYNHWPVEVWDAIDHHAAKPGMNELQVSFALGANMRAGRGGYGNRSVQYINGDKSTEVTFSDNKATSIEAGPMP